MKPCGAASHRRRSDKARNVASDETTRLLRQAQYLRQYYAETGREYTTARNVKCPNAAAHAHGDANASARIYENADGATVKCYGCGGAWDIFKLWQLDNGGTFAEAKKALCDRYGIARPSGTGGATIRQRNTGAQAAEVHALTGDGLPVETARPTGNAPQMTKPDAQTQAFIDRCATAYQSGADEAGRAYMRRRGISDETARRFKIGFDAGRQAVIFPQGAGYMSRLIAPDVAQKDKCRYCPTGAPRVLFNGAEMVRAARDNTPVFIVEGEVDALSIAECGGVAVSIGGTGGTGKAVRAAQYLKRGVYVPCLDRDKAGEKAQARLVEKLREIGGAVYVYADAPLILLPDGADGTHAKDANDELQRDAAAFRARVADVIARARAYAEAEAARHRPFYTLAELNEPPDEENNLRALFRRGFLRKGGGLIVASVAGAGKSTLSIQSALHWVMGRPCFGVDPVRPLRIALIQAEDDAEEMAMFRANMRRGLAAEGFTPTEIEEALRRLHIRKDFVGKTGADFAEALRAMQSVDHYDLVIVNPLNSFFDGDVSLNKDATEFFRKMIDPIIKDPVTECGIIFFHHSGKPAKGKDATNWGKGAFAQYILQGAAELNNWARAVLVLLPFDNAPDFWTLTAAKRHKPLAWKDADGKDTRDKVIAYSADYIYWREPSADEITAARTGTKPTHETADEKKRREEDLYQQAIKEIRDMLLHVPRPITATAIYKWCVKNQSATFAGFHSHTVKKPDGTNYPKKPCFLAFEMIRDFPRENGVALHVGKYKNGREYKLYGGAVDGQTGGVTVNPAAATATPNYDFIPQAVQAAPEEGRDIEELVAEQDNEEFWTDAPDADGNE